MPGDSYKKHAGHHVHAGAEGTEEQVLERRDHPSATGLSRKIAQSVRMVYSVHLADALPFHQSFPFNWECNGPVQQIVGTHLLPRPEAIMLLVQALVVGDVVFAVDEAAAHISHGS
jgi:hypothetical protein